MQTNEVETYTLERRQDVYLYEAIGHLRGQIEGLGEAGKRTDTEVHKLGNLLSSYITETNKRMAFMSRSITLLLVLVTLTSAGVPVDEWVKFIIRLAL